MLSPLPEELRCCYVVLYVLTLVVAIVAAVAHWSALSSTGAQGDAIVDLGVYGGVVGHLCLLLSSLAQFLRPPHPDHSHHPHTGAVLAGYSVVALLGDVCIISADRSALSTLGVVLNVAITVVQQSIDFFGRARDLDAKDVWNGVRAALFAMYCLMVCVCTPPPLTEPMYPRRVGAECGAVERGCGVDVVWKCRTSRQRLDAAVGLP